MPAPHATTLPDGFVSLSRESGAPSLLLTPAEAAAVATAISPRGYAKAAADAHLARFSQLTGYADTTDAVAG